MELSEIIIQKIRDEGPISFQQFMEMCLYYPGMGYYTSGRNPIGVNGDFYTSSSLSPVFGALIGRQLQEMWQVMDEEDFTIVEYGAGTGSLCHDILRYLETNKKMYDRLRYCIIERSPVMLNIERNQLDEKVCWYDSISDIPEIKGCIISNELIDNFSVHQVVMQHELMEVFVDYQGRFVEVLRPAREELRQYISELGITLPRDFRTEINLQATEWISQVAASLKRGYVITIDYGALSPELYKSYRSAGTLLCYRNHSINDLVYENIGSQDITSHINFSALRHWGSKCGLQECGFTDQCHFLLALGFKDYVNETVSYEKNIVAAARNAAMLTRTLLLDIGTKLKVLVQKKGLCTKNISGLRFSLPADAAKNPIP